MLRGKCDLASFVQCKPRAFRNRLMPRLKPSDMGAVLTDASSGGARAAQQRDETQHLQEIISRPEAQTVGCGQVANIILVS